MDTDQRIFQPTIEKTNQWMNELGEQMHTEDRDTYKALRATLHVLRDRMTIEEATDFASQLTVLLKGVYYDGYNPSHTPQKMDRTEVISRVHAYFDNDPTVNPERVITEVISFLSKKMPGGEMEHVKTNLPKDMRDFFPK
jgi:uncharacterized protein (DUF2267 family)